MQSTDAYILTEGDDSDTPMSNVISLRPSAAAEPISIGEEFAWILDDLAVRMRGNFDYPRILVPAIRGGD